MTRVTIGLTLIALALLFVAYGKEIGAMRAAAGAPGVDAMTIMYWATGALFAVALASFFSVAHLARSERMLRQLRALCEKHGVAFDGLE